MSHFVRGDAGRLPFAAGTFDLVFGSPPYLDARTYGIGAQRKKRAWIDWMLGVTAECLRACKGPVVWVAAGVTRKRDYQAACEGLMHEWQDRGVGSGLWLDGIELSRMSPGDCAMYRPCYWHRNGIQGSGGDQWFRADVEYVMCFKRPGKLPWSDNTAMGQPPKYNPGGRNTNRMRDGRRIHRKVWRTGRGVKDGQDYTPPEIANPGNLIHTAGGGGKLGSLLAHDNEAPFPEDLAEHFIRSLCPPGGLCLDPFSGSGTTATVARRHGRRAVGLDLRQSQCRLGRRRMATDTPLLPIMVGPSGAEPERPPSRPRRPRGGRLPDMPGQTLLFEETPA